MKHSPRSFHVRKKPLPPPVLGEKLTLSSLRNCSPQHNFIALRTNKEMYTNTKCCKNNHYVGHHKSNQCSWLKQMLDIKKTKVVYITSQHFPKHFFPNSLLVQKQVTHSFDVQKITCLSITFILLTKRSC